MITLKNISRYRAASAHLAISAAIAGLVLLVMFFVWYPPPLFMSMGGGQLAALIIGVDVCIGPLITLLIFDTRKKELAFDLAVVLALQLGALGYGVHTMFIARPAFIVFAEYEFVVVSAVDIAEDEFAKARIEAFSHVSLTGPQLAAMQLPEKLPSMDFVGLLSVGFQRHPKFYVLYDDKRGQVLKESKQLTDLELELQDRDRLEKYLKQSKHVAGKFRCLPVTIERNHLTAIIDAGNGDLVDILDIKPSFKKSPSTTNDREAAAPGK